MAATSRYLRNRNRAQIPGYRKIQVWIRIYDYSGRLSFRLDLVQKLRGRLDQEKRFSARNPEDVPPRLIGALNHSPDM